jgi:hypothetical protein
MSKALDRRQAQVRQTVRDALQLWKMDSGLAGVRDEAEMMKLPEDERKQWQDLWRSVNRLLEKAGRP